MLVATMTASGTFTGVTPIYVAGVIVKGGSNVMTVTFSDSSATTTTALAAAVEFGYGAGTGSWASPTLGGEVGFKKQCYVTVTGTSPTVYIVYRPIPNG